MGLNVSQVRFRPPTMPKAGGLVAFVFEARSTGARTGEKTTYSIPAPQPYVFANATDPADPAVVRGQRREVTLDPDDHSQLLLLRRIDSAEKTVMVLVNAEVFEVDAAGDPVLDGGGHPLPPHPLSGFITIE